MRSVARPIKRGLRKALNVAGYDLISARPIEPVASWDVDPSEASGLDAELAAFAAADPDRGPWSDPERAREYLSDKRLAFYHEVVRVCRECQIHFGNRRVADVGAGAGYLLRLIHSAAPGVQMTGYDVYDEIMALARHLCPSAEFVHRDLFDLDGAVHDVVFATEVIEHLIDPDGAVQALIRATAPSGSLIFTVPNGRNDTLPASGLRPDGRGYWGHIHFWSPESWPLFIERNVAGRAFTFGLLATGENYAVISV